MGKRLGKGRALVELHCCMHFLVRLNVVLVLKVAYTLQRIYALKHLHTTLRSLDDMEGLPALFAHV